MCGGLSHHLPTGDLAPNPGVCPDWELNQRPFGLQVSAQSTEPLQPGQKCKYFILQIYSLKTNLILNK